MCQGAGLGQMWGQPMALSRGDAVPTHHSPCVVVSCLSLTHASQQIGPDVTPRGNFTLLALINTGEPPGFSLVCLTFGVRGPGVKLCFHCARARHRLPLSVAPAC
jgi:sorbitol-specific phosphotransferase system component IIC